MTLDTRIKIYWNRLSIAEILLIFLPFTLVVPKLIPHILLGHDGETTHEFIVVGYLLCCVFGGIIEKRQSSKTPTKKNSKLIVMIGSLAIWSGFSIIWSDNAGMAIDHTIVWLCYFSLVFLGSAIIRKRSTVLMIFSIESVAAIISGLKLFQYWVTNGERVADSPLFSNLGVEPEILVTVMPLIIISQLHCRRKLVWCFNLITGSLCMMASLSTYQRTPVVALSCSLVVLIISFMIFPMTIRFKTRLGIFLIVLSISTIFQINLPPNAQGLSGAELWVKKIESSKKLNASGGGERLMLWDASFKMFKDNVIFGVGAGNFKSKYTIYRKRANENPIFSSVSAALSSGGNQADGSEVVYRAHNEFLQVSGELGLVGIIILSVIITSLLYLVLSNFYSNIGKASLAGMVGFLISSSLSSFSFRWIPCGLMFFLLVSLNFHNVGRVKEIWISNAISRKKVGIVLLSILLLAFLRTTQVLISQYFESKASFMSETDPNLSEQKNNYSKIITVDPYNYTAKFKQGVLLFNQKKYSESIEYLEGSVDHQIQGIVPYVYLATAYNEVSNTEKAESVLQEGIKLIPTSVVLKVIYSDFLKSSKKYKESDEQLNMSSAIDSEYTHIFLTFWKKGIAEAALESKRKNIIAFQQLGPSSVMQPLRAIRRQIETDAKSP